MEASTTERPQGAEQTDGKRNVGRIEEIQGVVIEAVFPDELPEIYSAIRVKLPDGFRVMPLIEAVRIADVIITVTGDLNVVDAEHFQTMKDGCIVANSGHFNDEINIPALLELARTHRPVRQFVEEYELRDGRRVFLLADGRLLNLAAAEGHPAAVMDMSFANQALSAVYIAQNADILVPGVYDVPEDIDKEVARLKLASLGIRIDELTNEQRRYLASWNTGT